MATQLLAVGSTAASSAEIPVADGSQLTVGIKGVVEHNSFLVVEMKDDSGGWNYIGYLNFSESARCLAAPGTYRLRRPVGSTCGAYSA